MRFFRQLGARSWALFGALWLFIGFALGTVVLLGPVRAIVSGFRRYGVSESIERLSVVASIAVLVLTTTAVAIALTRIVIETRMRLLRWGIPLLVFVAGTTAYLAWMNPELMRMRDADEQQIARFTFGPYPDYKRMQELRREGYTGVVSLLHPAVVPFEPQLLAKETRNASAAGMPLLHLPMLPWISDNTASLNRLSELAKADTGRYYVHCYLGVDRVLLAKRVVEQNAPGVKTVAVSTARSLSNVKELERGAVVELNPTTYVTPYPTHDEFVRYVLAAKIDHVVALLDPTDADDAARIADEQKIMQNHAMPFTLIPMSSDRYDPLHMLDAVSKVRSIPGRKVVHSFFGADRSSGTLSAAFVSAYRSGKPPLLQSIATHQLRDGSIRLPQPHIAVGPIPRGNELGGLRRYGVRQFVCVGTFCEGTARVAAENNWQFTRVDAKSLHRAVSGAGPYYVCGIAPERLAKLIDENASKS